MFQFWHAFVQPNLSLINLGLGKRVYRQRIEPRINEYMGKVFEKICLQYYERRIEKDMVPFLPEDYGNWWGNDSRRKQESEIDILSCNAEAMLFIECKWRNEKAHRKVLAELVEKSKMFKTDRKFYWIISMSGFHDVEHSLINAEMIDLKQVYSL
jgi:AAA+ ATPase superfamily predicted ATPase